MTTRAPKIGINTFLFSSPFTQASFGLFERFKKLGFDGVEIALENRSDFDCALAARAIRDAGLECVAVCGAYGPGRDLRGSVAEQRQTLDYIKGCVDACGELGCRLFAGPHYSMVGRAELRSERERQEDWRIVTENLRAASAYARERGVTLGLEPLNRFETDFITTSEQALAMIRDVGSPALKLHLDTFHMNIEERDIGEAVRLAAGELVHVHASDNDRGAPGSGHFDWTGLAAGLRTAGYTGWIVIESFTPEVKALARAASIWRTLEPSPDELASKGIAFLSRLFGAS